MDPLTGAALAVGVAWASILVAIHVPFDRWISPLAFRRVGASALALIGLGILGVPYAGHAATAVLILGLPAAATVRRFQRGRRERSQ